MFRRLRYLRIYMFSFVYRYLLILFGCKVGKRNIFLGRIEIRGDCKSIKIGDDNVFQKRVCLNTLNVGEGFGKIFINNNCLIGDDTIISSSSSINIKNNVEIAARCYVIDHDHKTKFTANIPQKVMINENVWVGTAVTILKGVNIGENSVIGANSLISKDLPPNVLAVGNPIKIVKRSESSEKNSLYNCQISSTKSYEDN